MKNKSSVFCATIPFDLETIGEYPDFEVNSNVLLLAVVFANFKQSCF